MSSLRKNLRIRLDAAGIEPNRLLGQHFLIEEIVLEKIAIAADVRMKSTVLEIGAGPGQFTEVLAARAKAVCAIEKDTRFLPILEEVKKAHSNLRIVLQDAREVSFADLMSNAEDPLVAANLPYYLTTELMEKCLIELPFARRMTFLVQKEAAERVMATPGTKQYGPLAVLAARYGTSHAALQVAPGSFMPPPKVGSTVLVLNKLTSTDAGDMAAFHSFLTKLFSTRRKTLQSTWRREISEDSGSLDVWLQEHAIDSRVRVEQLASETLWELFKWHEALV